MSQLATTIIGGRGGTEASCATTLSRGFRETTCIVCYLGLAGCWDCAGGALLVGGEGEEEGGGLSLAG